MFVRKILITFLISLGVLISSCNNKTITYSDSIPEMLRPDWTGINIDELPLKFGQIITLGNDSINLKAVVLDFNEDEGGKWIGICFIHQNQLFGRQIPNGIPNGLFNTTCLDLLDLIYLQENALVDYEIIEKIEVKKENIGIGANSSATNLDDLIQSFNWGIKQRQKVQTPCDEGLLDHNSIRECYFDIESKLGSL